MVATVQEAFKKRQNIENHRFIMEEITSNTERTDSVPHPSIEYIDLAKSPTPHTSECINYECKSGRDLMWAPPIILSHFRVETKQKNAATAGNQKVCRQCFTEACLQYDSLVDILKDGKLLTDVNLMPRHQLLEIDDDDNDEVNNKTPTVNCHHDASSSDAVDNNESLLPPVFSNENVDMLAENFDLILQRTLSKFNFDAHVDREVLNLMDMKWRQTDSLKQIQSEMEAARATLDRVHANIYMTFKPRIRELSPIDIVDDDAHASRSHVATSPLIVEVDDDDNNGNTVENKSGAAPKKWRRLATPTNSDEQHAQQIQQLANIGCLSESQIGVHDVFYVARRPSASWVRATIRAVTYVSAGGGASEGGGIRRYLVEELRSITLRNVTGRHLAPITPCLVRLNVGVRVIAAFQTATSVWQTENQADTADHYYAGIVAERPEAATQHRYLIFFDIGHAQYVSYDKVHTVVAPSADVCDDIPAQQRQFIRQFLSARERSLVTLSRGQNAIVEYGGKWLSCTVRRVDCSLVLVHFIYLNRLEWIYRGSHRFYSIFVETMARRKRGRPPSTPAGLLLLPPPTTSTLSPFAAREPSGDTEVVVVDDDGSTTTTTTSTTHGNRTAGQIRRAVARKSTTRAAPHGSTKSLQHHKQQQQQQQQQQDSSGGATDEGAHGPKGPLCKVTYYTPRDPTIIKRVLQPHRCCRGCSSFARHKAHDLRGQSPMAKPILCGWARLTCRALRVVTGGGAALEPFRRDVVYKAPCGRLLRNIEEVHRYLRLTAADLTVDQFDFEPMLRCLAEYQVQIRPDIKDLSGGQEEAAIAVINGYDNEPMMFSKYMQWRMPMPGVPLNLDTDFLVCCDCDDDCANKSKCQCWQLTLEGAKYSPYKSARDRAKIGYQYRRLYEQVTSGIYECNSRCACAHTCLNRVVQHPMPLKMQVFKTYKTGWGIRCVNDIPQGQFICIYAGTIHTDQMANEDGKMFGDEYFAELDYIEVCERYKEDYEADVQLYDRGADDVSAVNAKGGTPAVGRRVTEPMVVGEEGASDNEETQIVDVEDEEEDEGAADVDEDDGLDESVWARPVDGSRQKRLRDDSDFVPGVKVRTNRDVTMTLRKRNTNSTAAQGDEDDEEEPKEILNFNPSDDMSAAGEVADAGHTKAPYKSVRQLFGEEEPYIMDTKSTGNIGRFLNHSCEPNVFVQNVFVDSHDVRFPWVAFFSLQFIRAGTELTWNYNYDVGSVPGRVLYCNCRSAECKGRLL